MPDKHRHEPAWDFVLLRTSQLYNMNKGQAREKRYCFRLVDSQASVSAQEIPNWVLKPECALALELGASMLFKSSSQGAF
jgi:hypothetical protein